MRKIKKRGARRWGAEAMKRRSGQMDCGSRRAVEDELASLGLEYERCKGLGLKLDMQRGKPCGEQLEIAREMLDWGDAGFSTQGGVDARNYGGAIEGTPECRQLFADMLSVSPQNIMVWGNSSLNLMHDCIIKAMLSGVCGGKRPWLAQAGPGFWGAAAQKAPDAPSAKAPDAVPTTAPGAPPALKFLCPAPGYDRHFGITEHLGFELVRVDMKADGPDMDAVERIVGGDETVKGIWSVPKYSNPTGITYSDSVVRRFAALKPKADDFRIFWDNSYAVHDLSGEPDRLLNLLEEAGKHGNEDLVYMFTSTSKITFAGSGVTAMAASENNIRHLARQFSVQSISSDKLNQLRHVRFIRDMGNLGEIMARHAAIIRPKFDAVQRALRESLGESGEGLCEWTEPRGGYFISLNTPDFCAAEALRLAAEAGVLFTGAGSAFPYKIDPRDRNIRIAPTVPDTGDVYEAIKILCLCVKIAHAKKRLRELGAQSQQPLRQ
jgi:aspartate/methionine/tyrosine aminotransferase